MEHKLLNFDFEWLRVMLNDKVIVDPSVIRFASNTAKVMRMATEHSNFLDCYVDTHWTGETWELTFRRAEKAGAATYCPQPKRMSNGKV